MGEFKYTYLDDNHKEITGTMEGESNKEVALALKSFGYKVIDVRKIRENPLELDVKEILFGISKEEVITFTIQVATMLDSGLTILAALDVLLEQITSQGLKKIVRQMRRDVASGLKFSDALARHPKVFNDLYISMVKVGEATGLLDQVLNRLADFFEREEQIKSTIRQALTYPAFLILVAGAVIFFLMSFVLPRFTAIFKSFNVELPKETQLLLVISDFFGAYWKIVLGIVIGVLIFLRYSVRTRPGKAALDRFLLRFPLLAPIVIKSSIARFCHTLSTLMQSGVPIIRSLEITSSVIGNGVYANRINHATERVNEGNKLSESINDKRLFPPLMMRMLAVGENTGSTEGLMIKVRDYYERDVDKSIKTMVSFIEPALIIAMAIVVGFIVLAVMMPLLDMSRLYKT